MRLPCAMGCRKKQSKLYMLSICWRGVLFFSLKRMILSVPVTGKHVQNLTSPLSSLLCNSYLIVTNYITILDTLQIKKSNLDKKWHKKDKKNPQIAEQSPHIAILHHEYVVLMCDDTFVHMHYRLKLKRLKRIGGWNLSKPPQIGKMGHRTTQGTWIKSESNIL